MIGIIVKRKYTIIFFFCIASISVSWSAGVVTVLVARWLADLAVLTESALTSNNPAIRICYRAIVL